MEFLTSRSWESPVTQREKMERLLVRAQTTLGESPEQLGGAALLGKHLFGEALENKDYTYAWPASFHKEAEKNGHAPFQGRGDFSSFRGQAQFFQASHTSPATLGQSPCHRGMWSHT